MNVRKILQVGILVLSLALPAAALAKDPDVLLQEAIVNFHMGQFRKSIKLLKRARRKATDDRLKAQIHLYLGLNLGVLKKWRKARKAFTRALKMDPLLKVTDEVAKKSVVKLYRKVRRGLTGRVRVIADRQGVAVFLDGKEVGKTPYEAAVAVGSHKLVLRTADNLYYQELVLVVWHGKEYPIKGTLTFKGARLTVTSEPPGAKVIVDGKEVGVTPLKPLDLSAGDHELRVELEGHEAHDDKVTLVVGKEMARVINLKAHKPPEPPPTSAPVNPVEPVKAPPPPPPPRRKLPILTMVCAGVAVAAGGLALGMGLSYRSAIDEYESAGLTRDRWNALHDEIPQKETITNVAFAVGGAAVLATALVYFFVDRPAMRAVESPSSAATPAVSLSPTGAALTWDF